MSAPPEFRFIDPGVLSDGELNLVLVALKAPDPAKEWVPAYEFEIRLAAARKTVGTVNLRAVSTPFLEQFGGHVGYNVAPAFRGRHFAERGVRLILPLALRHGINPVWITCNPDNWPSRRTCERLGGRLVEIVEVPADSDLYLRGDRQKCRYRLDLA